MSVRATFRLQLIAFALALISFGVSGYVGYRYVGLVDCLAGQDLADRKRTAAISRATDDERRADLALLRAVVGGGVDASEVVRLRRAALIARENTDAVRAEHPAPPVQSCR